jgi:FkbM family methyltransferase
MKRNRQNLYRQFLNRTASVTSTYEEIVAGGTGYFRPKNIPGTFAISLKSAIATELLFNNGEYERDVVQLLKTLTPKRGDAVNIGANIGLICVLLAAQKRFSRIIAVEPNREAYKLLEENVIRNGHENQITCQKIALADTPGEVTLNFVPDQPEFSSLHKIVHPAVSSANQLTETVRADTLDHVVKSLGLRPSLLVIDTEGADALVLHGGRTCLEVHRPVVICECSSALMKGMPKGLKELETLFSDIRYRCLDVHTLRDFQWSLAESILLAVPMEEESTLIPQSGSST